MGIAYLLNAENFIEERFMYQEIVGNDNEILVLTGLKDDKEIREKQPKSNYVLVDPTDSFFKAKFENDVWVEGASTEEIESIKNVPSIPSELEILKKQQTDLMFELMLKGVL